MIFDRETYYPVVLLFYIEIFMQKTKWNLKSELIFIQNNNINFKTNIFTQIGFYTFSEESLRTYKLAKIKIENNINFIKL